MKHGDSTNQIHMMTLPPHQHHATDVGDHQGIIWSDDRLGPHEFPQVLGSLFGVSLGHDVHQRLQNDPMFASNISGGIYKVEPHPGGKNEFLVTRYAKEGLTCDESSLLILIDGAKLALSPAHWAALTFALIRKETISQLHWS